MPFLLWLLVFRAQFLACDPTVSPSALEFIHYSLNTYSGLRALCANQWQNGFSESPCLSCAIISCLGLPWWLRGLRNLPAMWIQSLDWEVGGEHGNPLQYSSLENPHGQRSLASYSLWGHKESDTTEQLSTSATDRLDWNESTLELCASFIRTETYGTTTVEQAEQWTQIGSLLSWSRSSRCSAAQQNFLCCSVE